MYIMAFESSCDETSVSIIKDGVTEVATSLVTQMYTHANYGGVVPEIASRMHVESITLVIDDVLKKANMKMEDIDAFAVAYGPGLIGSLLVGLLAAKTCAFVYNKPLIKVNHMAGHIYANNLEHELKFPLIASGGHTDLYYMDKDYSFNRLGGTLDDAVGEAYDKVARILGVPYPGGPGVDKLAFEGKDTYDLPIPLDDESYNFSFSGLKSAVMNLKHNEEQRGNAIIKENLACSFQNRVINILVKKTMKALKENNCKRLIIAGGVSANKGLREAFSKVCLENDIELIVPAMKFCTDNGAMIGAAAYYAYQNGDIADLSLNADSGLRL